MSYPKYIYDYPIGEDLFEGKSQEKVASNIVDYIKENSESKKRVVGIDGEWGSGKSNVIEIIRKKTENNFHIYTFDAWGHQEDLTRRTFLEELTDDLIKHDLLTVKWSEKLKSKLATNKVITTKNTPEFNSLLVGLVLLVLLSPLIKITFEYILVKSSWDFPGLFSLIFTLLFVVLAFGVCWFFGDKENKPSLGKLFFLYKGQQIKTTKHETITSLEPSVREFRNILREIIGGLKKPQKLIYVFDNMDRLPVNKVKEIWSSIHTFFSEADADKLNSWVLIPYDEKHICKVFSDEENRDNELTVSYIQKTFTIVFRIAPPILSDWKKYFEGRFKEAFNYNPPPQEQLANLFDYLHDDFTIKPRQIIDYINNIVALHKQWANTIPLRYYALFTLTKKEILENPVKVIIEKSFIKKVDSIFAGDKNLEKYIASLVFNVDKEKADEVLLRRSIEKTLRGEGNLGELSNHPAFITVLDSCFYNSEVDVENSIYEFDKLPEAIKDGKGFDKYWKKLTLLFISSEIKFPDCKPFYKKLFINLSSEDLKIQLLESTLTKINSYKVDNKLLFIGAKYSEIVDDFDKFFKDNEIKINVFDFCPEVGFEPNDYIEFVNSCNYDYLDYSVTCDEDEINATLIETLPVEIINYSKFIKTTKVEYDYTELKEKVEENIKTLTVSVPNYQDSITSLYDTYYVLSTDKPLSAKIPTNQIWQIYTNNLNHAKNIDMALSLLSDKTNRPTYIGHKHIVNLFNKTENAENAASIAEYYMTYAELIDLTLSNSSPLMQAIIKKITYKSYGVSTMSIKSVIGKYDLINSKIIKDDKDYRKEFLSRLNGWKRFYPDVFEKNTVQDFISSSFIKDCLLIDNDITAMTLSKVNDFIIDSSYESWKEAFENSDDNYLFSALRNVISINKNSFTKLPDNALNAYKDSIISFAKSNNIPSDVGSWDDILEYFDARRLKIPYKEIRDFFIYSPENVNTEAVLFLEKGLFLHGGLNDKDKVDDVIRKILIPCINDKSIFDDVIVRNKQSVVNIVKSSNEHKEDIYDAFRSINNDDNKESIAFFASNLSFPLVKEVIEEEKQEIDE